MPDIQGLEKRRLARESERTGIEIIWKLIEAYIFPFRGDIYGSTAPDGTINWHKRKIYDGTAAVANQNLGANMNSGLTNPLFQWFFLTIRQKEYRDIREVKEWLQEVGRIIFEQLRDSNFNLKANECYLDLPSYGTAAMVEEVEETDTGDLDRIVFDSMSVGDYVFEVDAEDNILTFWKKREWDIQQLEEKFGLFGLTEKLRQKAINNPNDTTKHEIIYCIFRRKAIDIDDRFQVVAPINRPYGRVYYTLAGKEMLGEEGGFYEMPIYLPRWRTTSGSVWGNSPAMVCLSNTLTLNEIIEYILKNLEKVVDPPTKGTKRGVISDVDLSAGGHTVVRNLKELDFFHAGGDFNAGEMSKKDLREMIKECFFMDQLQLKESPAMTATEVNARFQLMQRLLGPTLNRLQEDWLDKVVERTFGIMFRYKKLPPMPQILADNEIEWDIEYAGPIAKAQQEAQAQSIERFLTTVGNMKAVFEEAGDVPKVDELLLSLAELRGIPLDKLNDLAERTASGQRRGKQAALANSLQVLEGGANVAKTAAEAEALAAENG